MESKYVCSLCDKTYPKKYNLERHMKVCAEKNGVVISKQKAAEYNDSEKVIQELRLKVSTLDEKVISLTKKLKKSNKINKQLVAGTANKVAGRDYNDNSTVVVLAPFPEMPDLSKKEEVDILLGRLYSLPEYVKRAHCNKKYPEFRTVRVSNMKSKYGKTFNGEKWIMSSIDDIIDEICVKGAAYIEEILEKYEGKLLASILEKVRKGLEVIDWQDDDTDTEDKAKIKRRKQLSKLKKDIKEKIKLVLYNESQSENKTSEE